MYYAGERTYRFSICEALEALQRRFSQHDVSAESRKPGQDNIFFQDCEVNVMKHIMSRENCGLSITEKLTAIFTLLMMLAGIPGLIVFLMQIVGSADRSAVQVLHFLYLVSMVVGVTTIMVKVMVLPGNPKEFKARSCRGSFRSCGNIFIFLALWELVYASADGVKTGLFEIFNLEITLQLILFVFNAFIMYSIARFLDVYAAYEEDSRLTI